MICYCTDTGTGGASVAVVPPGILTIFIFTEKAPRSPVFYVVFFP